VEIVMGNNQDSEKPIEKSSFELGNLPDAVLSFLFAIGPIKDSGRCSLVNKKFAAAFKSTVTWKCRCERELDIKV
jgi:hypothetical protein